MSVAGGMKLKAPTEAAAAAMEYGPAQYYLVIHNTRELE